MGARENLQRIADRKYQEIAELERQLEMSRVYLQAIQDSIKALPREVAVHSNGEDTAVELRPGSALARVKEAIGRNGAPMHIVAILSAIGVENTKNTRVSLVGSLGSYVRKGSVFNRPAPNTFGLVGMDSTRYETGESKLPESFGKVAEGV
jgi:hypothetical protein